MSRLSDYVSEQWLRIHVYERGKASPEEQSTGSDGAVHLAEARITLRFRWDSGRSGSPSDCTSSMPYPDAADVDDDWSPEGRTVA